MRDHRSSLGALMEHLSHSLDSSVFVATNCIKDKIFKNKYTSAHCNNLCNC